MQTVNSEARQWLAGEWLNGAALAPLAELNSQCLELVGDMATAGQGSLLQQALGRQIAGLSREARAGLASAPYLLADAGFDNPNRWQGLARWRVEDVPREPAPNLFVGAQAPAFIRGVFVYGWHLARAHRQLARVVLGMSPGCARVDRRARPLRSGLGLPASARLGEPAVGDAAATLEPAPRRRAAGRSRRASAREPARHPAARCVGART